MAATSSVLAPAAIRCVSQPAHRTRPAARVSRRQQASARLIQSRDSVAVSFHAGELFYVFGVTAESDGTVLLILADVDLGERLDVELKLITWEHE
jgi:hypothetical protein